MTWIKTIPFAEAKGRLKRLYDRIKGPDDSVDNIMMAHSLRAHSMEGHMALYKNVLHHTSNTIPAWFLEVLGVYVSHLNGCAYCVDHHFAGLKKLLGDDKRADEIKAALLNGIPSGVFKEKELAALLYARKLTQNPDLVKEADVEHLRIIGWDDGEILEINQVVSYFAYANRTVLGLGISTEGEPLGRSPADSDDDKGWSHQ